MQLHRLALLVSMLVSLPACYFIKANFSQQKSAAASSSLFDHLIALAPNQQVPYPFAKLLAYLAQYGQPVGVLVPLGLSQLRQAGYPEPFKDPRRIVGFSMPELNKAQTLYLELFKKLGMPQLRLGEFTISNRLFLAYTQKSQQVEVMSLLPHGVGFDYQVVKNYGPAKSPSIVAADRQQCRSCHQYDILLTSPNRFDGFIDSNTHSPITALIDMQISHSSSDNDVSSANPLIARLIAQHYPDGVLDGIPISISKRKEKKSDRVYRFKDFHQQVASTLNNNGLWHAGCLHPPDKIACRKLMLRHRFGCTSPHMYRRTGPFSFMGVIAPARCLPEKVLKLKPSQVIDFRHRGGPEFVNKVPEMQQDFTLSTAGQQVLAKIKATKLGDIKEDSIFKDMTLYDIFSTFIRAAGGGVDFAVPEGLPPLNAADLAIIYDEVERLFIHVHRKDLHLNTSIDPTYKHKTRTAHTNNLRNFRVTKEVTKMFEQQALLAANKIQQDIELVYSQRLSVIFKTASATSASIFIAGFIPYHKAGNELFDLPHDETIGISERALWPTITCQKIKNVRRCAGKNIALDTAKCQSCKDARLDMTLHVTSEQVKPPVSPVTLKLNGKSYDFALLCINDQDYRGVLVEYEKGTRYICGPYDTWKVSDALEQLAAAPHSALHSDYFNPTAIIRDMFKNFSDESVTAR